MTTFIIIALLLAVIIIICIPKNNKKSVPEKVPIPSSGISISVSTEPTKPKEDDTYHEPIKQVADGWVINPGCPFELTVLDCDFETAQRIREKCDQGSHRADKELLSLFATKNIKIKEIEEYKKKYSPIYYQRVEELKATSVEYLNADPKDRDNLLEGFYVAAQDSLYELPEYDVYKLFYDEDITVDDALLQRYGFDCLEAYLVYYGKIGSVIAISKESYYRPAFEEMVNNGMAIRGKDIPITEILTVQTLKTLNAIANNPQKEFKRKNQAIEYILNNDEPASHIGEHVAFLELFKLIPLPSEYDGIDLDAIHRVWECHRVEIQLLMRTYRESIYQWQWKRFRNDYVTEKLFKTCKVSCMNEKCKCGQDRMKRTYSVDAPPKAPCHIGCSCWLAYE